MIDHDFPFDPTYGYDEAALRAIEAPPAPDGFADFWAQTYEATRALPLNLTRGGERKTLRKSTITDISFETLGGLRIGGWAVVPDDWDGVTAFVVGHGYGGREMPDHRFDLCPTAACIYPCAPGFHASAADGIPDNAGEHVVHGIESRETYIIRHCVASLWSAVSVAETLFPGAETIHFHGGSFGGGLGALMLPWEPRVKRAHLHVPTFGHHPIRLKCPCQGSGEAVRAYAADHPEVIEVLRFFDAATAASHIDIPVMGSPALFDPAVPPPGQFAVVNACSHPDSVVQVHQTGHFADDPSTLSDHREMVRAGRRFFAALG